MAEYQLAPWVGQPANPSANYATGFQLGVHLGAQQAAHAFQAQQLAQQQQRIAMEAQKQELDNAYQAQLLNLKVGEMARQHQAQQMFSTRVAMGEDPSRVLMELAPALGESPSAILRDQRLRDQASAEMSIRQRMLGLSQQREGRMATQGDERLQLARQKAQASTAPGTPVIPEVVTVETSEGPVELIVNKKTGRFERASKLPARDEFVTKNLIPWMSKTMSDKETAAKDLRDVYDNQISKPRIKTGQGVGDNTLPDVSTNAVPTQPVSDPSSARVRMKRPDGKIGTIPESQVGDAIKEGWVKL